MTRVAETRDEYMADADRSATQITQLQSEIMTLLGKMGVERPQQPIQESDVFLNNTPFVVVLIDGSKSMVRHAPHVVKLTDHVHSLRMNTSNKGTKAAEKQ